MAMLELYLIRHGIAEERGEDWPDDSKRPLTPAGLAKLRKEARGLTALGVTIEQIVASPLVRTRQTADVFSETLKNKPPVTTSDALGQPGREVGARDAARRRVRAREAGKIGVTPTGGECQQVGRR